MAIGEYPNKLVSEVVFRTPATSRFERQDWIDLAMAALDQAELSVAEQEMVESLISQITRGG